MDDKSNLDFFLGGGSSVCSWEVLYLFTSKKVKLIELNKFKLYIYADFPLLQLIQEVMSFKLAERC